MAFIYGVWLLSNMMVLHMLTFRAVKLPSLLLTLTLTLISGLAVANDNPPTSTVDASMSTALYEAQPIRVGRPGPYPNTKLISCTEIDGRMTLAETAKVEGDDVEVVRELLTTTSPDHGLPLFMEVPGVVMWWVRTLGSISAQSIGVAVHESNHAVDAALTRCNRGLATYRLRDKTYKTEHIFGDTPAYAIIGNAIPASLKSPQVGSRYPQYIERNGSHPGSDFSILLDEFVAYAGAASVDLAIAKSKNLAWLVSPQVTGLDVNVGGVADFMIYTLSYLKALRKDHPGSYSILKRQSKTIGVLQTIWTIAEKTLVSAYSFTKNAGTGGLLLVSAEAISIAYSEEFLSELDLMGITHMSRSQWASNYLLVDK